MPQRRKQQKGAGLFDILSSDPAKKIEANNKRIGELEKESEQKCAELKKKIDVQIGELEKKNEVLQKAVDEKKVEEVKQAESGSVFDGFKNFFGSKSDEAKPVEAKPPVEAMVKPTDKGVSDMKVVNNPMMANAVAQPNGLPQVGQEAKKDNFDRMFGGKKSKRRRGSKARKSAKK
jgi:hypothetical protein